MVELRNRYNFDRLIAQYEHTHTHTEIKKGKHWDSTGCIRLSPQLPAGRSISEIDNHLTNGFF